MEQPTADEEVKTSPEEVREVQKQTQIASINFMNQMETSAPKNGDLFILFGEKDKSDDPRFDSRALIFKHSIESKKHPGNRDHLVITREGPKILSANDGEWNTRFARAGREDHLLFFSDGRLGLISYLDNGTFPLEDIDPQDQSLAQELMSKSIEPSKNDSQDLEAEQQKQAMARELSDLLKPSAQPPVSAGPTPPTV